MPEEFCPSDWVHVSGPPTKPGNIETPLTEKKFPLSGVVAARKSVIEFNWKRLPIPEIQGLCGQQINFTTGWSFAEGTETSWQLGGIVNIPGIGEVGELQGGFQLSFSKEGGQSIGGEMIFGPEKCWEYMAIAVGLEVRIGTNIKRPTITWYESIIWPIYNLFTSEDLVPQTDITVWLTSFFMRGSLVICKHWCCSNYALYSSDDTFIRWLSIKEAELYEELIEEYDEPLDGEPFGIDGEVYAEEQEHPNK